MHKTNFRLIQQFLKIIKENPSSLQSLADSVSDGQLASKEWLVLELEKLEINLGTIFLCAGWYATLAYMLFESKCTINKVRSFDIDSSCEKIAETINRDNVKDDWTFKAATIDIQNIHYNDFEYLTYRNNGTPLHLTDTANTIINTSCEHIKNFSHWYNNIPAGKLIILQTSDYEELEDHINCSKSLEDFAKQTPMANVLYAGNLKLEKYTRFMRIGIR